MTTPDKCPICDYTEFQIRSEGSSREFVCDCKRCGRYFTTHQFLLFRQDRKYAERWHLLSGLVREINESGGTPEIMYNNLEAMFADSRIPKDDDADGKSRKILSYIRRHSLHYGDDVQINLEAHRSIGYARNDEEFNALICLLRDSGLLEGDFPRTSVDQDEYIEKDANLILTASGWKAGGERDGQHIESKQGFIAIRFDEDADPFIAAIEQGITEAGYQPLCIKEKHYPERIMDKAIGEIRRSRFVVVDLTKNRCAVSFEAGFAHALGIECISVCQKGEKVEDFYAKHYKYIQYESPEDLKVKIIEAIRARMPVPRS